MYIHELFCYCKKCGTWWGKSFKQIEVDRCSQSDLAYPPGFIIVIRIACVASFAFSPATSYLDFVVLSLMAIGKVKLFLNLDPEHGDITAYLPHPGTLPVHPVPLFEFLHGRPATNLPSDQAAQQCLRVERPAGAMANGW